MKTARDNGPPANARAVPDYSNPAYWRGTIKMSLSKFFVLSVLQRKPMHGYEVVQAVAQTTNGCCSPTEGTVYPVLNEFERGGYLSSTTEVVQGRQRRIYHMTARGQDAFQTAVEAWLEATDCIMASSPLLGKRYQRTAADARRGK